MNNVQEQYRGLLSSLVYGGKQKDDRTGVGTRSVFGRILRHDMSTGFPLLTTKKIYFNHAVTELLWILQGRSDIGYLNDNGLTYWNADYERSGRRDGTLGPVYGVQWRNFNGVDQIRKLIREIKSNPTSRRLMVNAWNAADIDNMAEGGETVTATIGSNSSGAKSFAVDTVVPATAITAVKYDSVVDADGVSVAAAVANNAALVLGGVLASSGAVTNSAAQNVTITSVDRLDPSARTEEIARMLSGASITAEARAAALSLIEG